jgi:glutamate 5-kinase
MTSRQRIKKQIKDQQMSYKPRVVVKLGTTTIMREEMLGVNLRLLDKIARVLSDVRGKGWDVVLVSSGAIAVGANKLRFSERPTELRMKQASAAVGQLELMHLYDKLFGEYGQTIAQILLTDEDVANDSRKVNLRRTFDALLELGVIPVVNENDSVSTSEVETGSYRVLGDNDTLSAIVAELINAQKLILLSDVDRLYDADPRTNPSALAIEEIREITSQLREIAGDGGKWGTGGMRTKLSAGEVALAHGIEMTITHGKNVDAIYDILDGKHVGTRFIPMGIKD